MLASELDCDCAMCRAVAERRSNKRHAAPYITEEGFVLIDRRENWDVDQDDDPYSQVFGNQLVSNIRESRSWTD